MPREIQFEVPSIVCGSCTATIKHVLNKEHLFEKPHFKKLAIKHIATSEITKNVYIEFDSLDSSSDELEEMPETLLKEIIQNELDEVGFPPDFEIKEAFQTVVQKNDKSKQLIRRYLIKGIIGTLFGVGFLVLCAGGFTLPLYAMYLLGGLSSALALYLGKDTYKAALNEVIKTKTFTMNTLFTVSTLTAMGVSVASLFVSWLPMMFDAALLIFGFRYLGIAIEEKVRRSVTKNVLFQDKIPKEVEVENEKEKIPVESLKPGDRILVRKGEMVPVDSVCDVDWLYVDASIYTGNSRLLMRRGESLVGGMLVLDQDATLVVQKAVTDPQSFLAQADKKLETMHHTKAPVEEIADKILKYFVPIVFGLTIVSGICIGLLFTPALALQCVISMLVSACPCTLGFIVPLSVKMGIAKGIENGIEFTSGKSLQETAKINAMVFDLNGTLTNGTPEVICLKSTHKDIDEDNIKKYFNILEKKSEHTIGRTIYYYTILNGIEDNNEEGFNIIDTNTPNHSGISKIINGVEYTVGNSTMLKNLGIHVKTNPDLLSLRGGEQVIYLARGKEEIGYIIIQDALREDAKTVVNELQKKNIEVFLCTGADKTTAENFARELNIKIENVAADRVPFTDNSFVEKKRPSKVDFIQSLQNKGYKVGMVGDGNNDTFAMTQSDVGFGVFSHSNGDVARDNAGAIVKGSSLLPVLSGIVIAKQTIRNIKQNLAISLTYNMTALLIAGGLLVAVGFALNPAIGVALMVLQTCLVLLSVYYLKRQQLPQLDSKNAYVTANMELKTHATVSKFFKSNKPNPSEKPKAQTKSDLMIAKSPSLPQLLTQLSQNTNSSPISDATSRFIPT